MIKESDDSRLHFAENRKNIICSQRVGDSRVYTVIILKVEVKHTIFSNGM